MNTLEFCAWVASLTPAEAQAAYGPFRAKQENDYQHVCGRAQDRHARNVEAVRLNASRGRQFWMRDDANDGAAEQMERDMRRMVGDYDELVWRKRILAVRRGSYDASLYHPTTWAGSSLDGCGNLVDPDREVGAKMVCDARRADPGVVVPPEPPPYEPPLWRAIKCGRPDGGPVAHHAATREALFALLTPGHEFTILEAQGRTWRKVDRLVIPA